MFHTPMAAGALGLVLVALSTWRVWTRAGERRLRYARVERARRPRYTFLFRKHGWRVERPGT